MAEILYLRARRFEALHDLLTGAACPEHSPRHRRPEGLLKNVGLLEGERPVATHRRRGIGLTNCCAHASQVTRERRTEP